MRHTFKSFFIALILTCGVPASSEAIPPGIPSQQCSTISRPLPGSLCYTVHENQGGKATAGGSPQAGELIIQPQYRNYVVVEARSEVTGQHGNGSISKRVLSRGASIQSINGYRTKLEELDRITNELEGKIAGTTGQAVYEAKNKLTYLRERRRKYAEYYQTAVSAGRDAPKIQFSWSASSRSCGWANLDTCGSVIHFRVYEVRRYLGDPIAEYNRLVVPALNEAKEAVQKLESIPQSGDSSLQASYISKLTSMLIEKHGYDTETAKRLSICIVEKLFEKYSPQYIESGQITEGELIKVMGECFE